MLYINKLTTDPQQNIILTGIPGLSITMTLRFMPRVKRWMMGLQTANFELNGLPVVTSPNMLRQFQNQISFGIACVTASGVDPFTINDFATQSSNLYLLTSTDVAQVEEAFYS